MHELQSVVTSPSNRNRLSKVIKSLITLDCHVVIYGLAVMVMLLRHDGAQQLRKPRLHYD